MRDFSYHTVSSIINAFEKSVNFHFNVGIMPFGMLNDLFLQNRHKETKIIHY